MTTNIEYALMAGASYVSNRDIINSPTSYVIMPAHDPNKKIR